MSISGINNYNYPNYYAGARHNMAKTGGRDSGVLSSTSSASSNITLHMSDGGNSGNALTAMGFPDGTSASVFKADDYNLADPEYKKGEQHCCRIHARHLFFRIRMPSIIPPYKSSS